MLLLKKSRSTQARHPDAYDLAPEEQVTRPPRHASAQRKRPSPAGPAPAPNKPVFLFALVLGLCAGIFYFSAGEDYLLGQLAAATLAPLALHGLWRGAFRKIIMLAVIAGLVIYGGELKQAVSAGLSAAGISSTGAAAVMTFIAAFLIWLVAFISSRTIRRRFIERRPRRLALDRIFGTAIGLTEAAAILLCICWAATSLEPYGTSLADGSIASKGETGRVLGETIVRLSKESRVRFLGNLVIQTNPVERIPELQKAVHDLNTVGRISPDQLDPEKLQQLQRLLEKLPGTPPIDASAMPQSSSKSPRATK